MLLGVVAGLAAHINFLLYKKKLSNWYGLEEFDYLNRLAFAFIAVTISGFVYHLVYYGLMTYHNCKTFSALKYNFILKNFDFSST